MLLEVTRNLINTKKISDDLVQRTYISLDNQNLMLEVDYKKKKFVIERSFTNNYLGKEQMAEIVKDFDTEEKVKKHLGLK